MVIFWAYMAFSQLLVYWIGDIPDEVTFYARADVPATWTAVDVRCSSSGTSSCRSSCSSTAARSAARTCSRRRARGCFVMHFVDVYWLVLPVHDRPGVRAALARPRRRSSSSAACRAPGSSARYGTARRRCRCTCPELADGLELRGRRMSRGTDGSRCVRKTTPSPAPAAKIAASRSSASSSGRRRAASRPLLASSTSTLRPTAAAAGGRSPGAARPIADIEQTPLARDAARGLDLRAAAARRARPLRLGRPRRRPRRHPDRASDGPRRPEEAR